jgi:VWFA-related protein
VNTPRALLVAVTILVLASISSLHAQTAIPSLGESIEIAIVNVDVVVTDADGRRVYGLTRDDFQIYENGKLQPLSHFAAYREPTAATAGSEGTVSIESAEERAPEQRRTLILFLEHVKLPGTRLRPFIASLKQLVKETIRPGDSVSLIVFEQTATVVVPPTADAGSIDAALDTFAVKAEGPVFDSAAVVANHAAEVRKFEEEAASMAQAGGLSLPPTSEREIIRSATFGQVGMADLMMKRRVAAINAVLNGMAGIDGKKIMLLAAHRLGSFIGAEHYFAAGAEQPPQGDSPEYDNVARMRSVIANANAAGVTLYPVFPAGLDQVSLSGPDTTRQVLMYEMAMRNEIAEKTGGLTTYGGGDIAKLMPAVADDMSDYYSLAYRAPTRRADEARDIVVKTRNPKLKVRSRRQFVEKSDDSRMRDRVVAAMYDTGQPSPIRVVAELGEPKKGGRNRRSIPIAVRIPIEALTLIPQGQKHAGAFSVYVMTGAELGAVSEVTRKTQSFEVDASDLARALKSHFTFDVDVEVNTGADHVAVGLLDEVSRTYGVTRLPLPK